MLNDKILVFSVFAGEFYEIPAKDEKHPVPEILPLISKPKNCKKCYNRGFTGRNSNNFAHIICSCVQKVLDLPKIKATDERLKSH